MAKLRKKSKGAVPSIDDASDNLTPAVEPIPIEPGPVRLVSTKKGKVSEELKALNFKVSASFKKEYKQFALDNDMSLVDVLKLSFSTYRKLTK